MDKSHKPPHSHAVNFIAKILSLFSPSFHDNVYASSRIAVKNNYVKSTERFLQTNVQRKRKRVHTDLEVARGKKQ